MSGRVQLETKLSVELQSMGTRDLRRFFSPHGSRMELAKRVRHPEPPLCFFVCRSSGQIWANLRGFALTNAEAKEALHIS